MELKLDVTGKNCTEVKKALIEQAYGFFEGRLYELSDVLVTAVGQGKYRAVGRAEEITIDDRSMADTWH